MDPSPPTRNEPCEILRRGGVACLLWLEDAIANYNVPTCVFDRYLLVSDLDDAARRLHRAGWIDVGMDARPRSFLTRPPQTIQYLYLDPPTVKEKEPSETMTGLMMPPLPEGPLPPTRTILLSASDFSVSIERLLPGLLLHDHFIPPLAFLVDGLISGVLDAPPESPLDRRLYIQLVYLYAHCRDMDSPELIGQLRPENRQFHIDALTGPSVGKSPLIAWGRQVKAGASGGDATAHGGELASVGEPHRLPGIHCLRSR